MEFNTTVGGVGSECTVKKRQDGGETSQGLREEGNSEEGRVKTVDTLHDTSMTLTVMLLLYFENKVTILYIFEEVKKKKNTYFGNIFNWFSLSSKICSLVNLWQSKKKKKSFYYW